MGTFDTECNALLYCARRKVGSLIDEPHNAMHSIMIVDLRFTK